MVCWGDDISGSTSGVSQNTVYVQVTKNHHQVTRLRAVTNINQRYRSKIISHAKAYEMWVSYGLGES